MNNEQFRRLVSTNIASKDSSNGPSTSTSPPANPTRTLLGARPKSSAPSVTGRSYSSSFFAQHKSSNGIKKPKTTVPKGTKLAAGYVDRTLHRQDEEDDETAQRLKALEERMKEGEIEMDEFERLRDEITAGDIGRTHLVKGLDRKLLERIRRGEDVLREKKKGEGEGEEEVREDDDAFEELEKHDVVASKREQRVKQGEKARIVPGAAVAGQKRTRDQILAEMKAARDAAKAAARPQLGSGFKKIRKEDGPRIEVDERGREVLISVDEEGNVKRRVKKAKVEEKQDQPMEEFKKSAKGKDVPLGADVVVPTYEPLPEEESDEDIFAGAGHDFNPLADLEDEDASDTEAKAISKSQNAHDKSPTRRDQSPDGSGSEEGEARDGPSPPRPAPESTTTTTRQNYFNDDPTSLSVLSNMKSDLSIAALAKSQRAQALSENPHHNETAEDAAKRKRREAMLTTRDRDMEDMDMGFGGSRFDDAEEMAMEGEKVKFSKWTGGGGEEEGSDGEGGKGGGKRKRGPKKRKGDKNSAADVMGAMERQRKG